MAILLPADPDAPLDQGDVLAGVARFRTLVDGGPGALREGMVMVLSRPCNAVRDGYVVVAPVEQGNIPQIRGAETPEELIRAYTRIRDGEGAPDRFYLGEVPGKPDARHFATLGELYTIVVPEEPRARQEFLRARRTLRLDPAFARDLHLRLFRAFASLGFDDAGWWPESDLKLVVQRCDAWAGAADAAVADWESKLNVLRQSGDPAKREVKAATEELEKARAKAVAVREQYAALRQELARRNAGR